MNVFWDGLRAASRHIQWDVEIARGFLPAGSFIALVSWNFVDQAGVQRCPVGPAASMCKV